MKISHHIAFYRFVCRSILSASLHRKLTFLTDLQPIKDSHLPSYFFKAAIPTRVATLEKKLRT